jgi:PilZ domain
VHRLLAAITGEIRKQRREQFASADRSAYAGRAHYAGPNHQSAASRTRADRAGERRQHPRFKCEGTVEFQKDGIEARVTGQVSDISESGCYVEMQATSPPGTALSLVLDVEGIRVHAHGTVQVCYPMLGMGIAFTRVSPADHAELERLVQHLANREAPTAPPVSSAAAQDHAPALLMLTDAGAALSTVAEFFADHPTLTREKFKELICQSQERTRR